jgi:hypothetical protein
VKNKPTHSLNSEILKTNEDSPNLSARCFISSGSSRFSPYQIDVSAPETQNRTYPLSATSGEPDVETTTVPSEFLESTNPDILASAPDGERKCACNGTRSVSSLLNNASASLSEIWGTAASLLYASDSRVVRLSGKNERILLSVR